MLMVCPMRLGNEIMMIGRRPLLSGLFGILLLTSQVKAEDIKVWAETDPLTRYVMIHYAVPPNVPDHAIVSCRYRLQGGEWKPASVRKHRSWTAETMVDSATLVSEQS